MTILVTGGTGTIGTQVLNFLDGHGAEVRALTRSPEKAQFPAGVAAVKGDLSDIDSVRAALNGVSTPTKCRRRLFSCNRPPTP
jgi:uncharacterized protein YbjT (DUF2867 family)